VLLWVVVTRTQLTKLVSERNQGKTISMCAMKAGMSRKTAGKYLGSVPNGANLRRIWDKVRQSGRVEWPQRKNPGNLGKPGQNASD
jgi:hypothetical protein